MGKNKKATFRWPFAQTDRSKSVTEKIFKTNLYLTHRAPKAGLKKSGAWLPAGLSTRVCSTPAEKL